MIGLLLIAWAILLVPSLSLGRRAQASPIDGVRRFESTMGILANTRASQGPGRWVMVPKDLNNAPQRRRTRIIRRRRQTFMRLLFSAGVTLILGLVPQLRVLLLVHLVLDVALAGYIVQLRRWAKDERARTRRAAAASKRLEEASIHALEAVVLDVDEEHDTIDFGSAVSR